MAASLSELPSIVVAVTYTSTSDIDSVPVAAQTPTLRHVAGSSDPRKPTGKNGSVKQYYYPEMKSHLFATPFQDHFHYITESLSHTRNLTFIKPKVGGPYFDLEEIWDEHCFYEFADRSVEHTMSTMVQEPYVNHVPTVRSPSPCQNPAA